MIVILEIEPSCDKYVLCSIEIIMHTKILYNNIIMLLLIYVSIVFITK